MVDKPSIFITGAGGFSGWHIAKYLVEKGHSVRPHLGRDVSDLTKDTTICSFPSDVLIHTAAVSPTFSRTPTQFVDNIRMTENLIRWAKGPGQVKKIIFFSSVSLYGDVPKGVLDRRTPRTNPSVYGETKHICEEILYESGIPTFSLQLPAIVGKGARRHKLSGILDNAKQGRLIVYHSPLTMFNNVVHIDYLCQIIEEIINKDIRYSGSWLLGSTVPVSMEYVVNCLTQPFGRYRHQVISNIGPPSFYIDLYEISELCKFVKPWTTTETLLRYVEDEL